VSEQPGAGADERRELAPEDEALLALLARGPLAPADLLAACGAPSPGVEGLPGRLERAALVVPGAGGRVALTSVGRERAAAVLARERRALAREVAAIEGPFARLNERVKTAIAAWQVRRVGSVEVTNDHSDARYDAAVTGELCAAVGEALALLSPLAGRRRRYAAYRDRLARAVRGVRSGERALVSGLEGDAIHGIWWQLHAEILGLLGRARGASDA
jgi:hypothetical protein